MTSDVAAPRTPASFPDREVVVGLVVNPVAGLGGAAGLKGSDGAHVQREALARGATPRAGERAARAVRALLARRPGTRVVTVPGSMGEHSARAAGAPFTLERLSPGPAPRGTAEGHGAADPADRADLVDPADPADQADPAGSADPAGPAGLAGAAAAGSGGETSAQDTRRAVIALADVDLLLFAGGDGTARDVLDAVRTLGDQAPPVLGIPAGVKVYSGCFGLSPAAAGFLAAEHVSGLRRQSAADHASGQGRGPRAAGTVEAEVVDLDEERYRQGLVSPRLYGSLRVPAARAALSGRKAGSSAVVPAGVEGIAREVVARMRPGVRYVLGPGATTQAVGRELGLATTLLGVDVVEVGDGGVLVAGDVSEAALFALVTGGEAVVVLSVIGGQGFVLGRGNQQVSPRVLDAVIGYGDAAGPRLLVLATSQKLAALRGRPLLADSGDEDLDRRLSGHVQVITGYRESTIYQICTASEEFHG
ncbi:ATP-NAD kinase family protein [Nonomuraea mangrovi]|uniref:ATP-NAD kinase family protein n=1 Tax=Nonomuraea mangrovi TaxID=2316207 RepID=A0ABW4T8T3_9ACTN